MTPPRTGRVSWYFGNPSKKEIDDLPMKPSPPPATNIDTGLPQPPPLQGGCALDSTLVYLPTARLYSRDLEGLAACKLSKERMITRCTGKLETAKQLKEIRQTNKKTYQKQRQQKEEEDKPKNDEAEAARRWEEDEKATKLDKALPPAEDPSIATFSKSVRDIMEGVQDMETEGQPEDEDDLERSPFKKRPGSSKVASRRRTGNRLVSPTTEQETIPQAAPRTISFLDTFIYPHS